MFLSSLTLGILLGAQHAFDPDHLAAVATLNAKSVSSKEAIKQGMFWGLGHTLTLFAICSVVILLGSQISEPIADMLEFVVGLMLVVLGGNLVRLVIKNKIHFHKHKHGDIEHFHAHSHVNDTEHDINNHHHKHVDKLPLRALMIGLIHGLAGSAALSILALGTVDSILQGLGFVLLFGLGSIVGMVAISASISIPLKMKLFESDKVHQTLRLTIGAGTFFLGGSIMWNIGI